MYMPMTPYAVYAMLACARIGAIHNVIFAGFSADAIRARILNSNSTVVITGSIHEAECLCLRCCFGAIVSFEAISSA